MDKISEIIQGYLGMTPQDKGCKNWSEMQEKMIKELDEVVKNINHDTVLPTVNAKEKLLLSIKNGTHKQFVYNKEKDRVECKCGNPAVFMRTGYICGTITAYPCKYN